MVAQPTRFFLAILINLFHHPCSVSALVRHSGLSFHDEFFARPGQRPPVPLPKRFAGVVARTLAGPASSLGAFVAPLRLALRGQFGGPAGRATAQRAGLFQAAQGLR